MFGQRGVKKGIAGVITGASSGIGRALAVLLARRYKARLVLNARTESALEETRKLVEQAGGSAICIAGDMGDLSMPHKLVQACLDSYGAVELLVNNAGLAKPGAVTALTPEDWERVFAVNFFAPLYGTYEVLPHFLQNKYGKIVNISSVAGKVAFPGSVCYAASKFALTGMSEGMAAELACKKIDVITVCPGWVRTEFFAKNNVSDLKNPTLIAQKNDLRGIMMRYFLSISSEQAAADILKALERGGSSEIVLTTPGIFVERVMGMMPQAIFAISKRVPMKYVDTSVEACVEHENGSGKAKASGSASMTEQPSPGSKRNVEQKKAGEKKETVHKRR